MHCISCIALIDLQTNSANILVTDCDTGEIVFFGTQNEASEEFGLSKITLNKLARYEKVRNNLQYKLFRLKEGI